MYTFAKRQSIRLQGGAFSLRGLRGLFNSNSNSNYLETVPLFFSEYAAISATYYAAVLCMILKDILINYYCRSFFCTGLLLAFGRVLVTDFES